MIRLNKLCDTHSIVGYDIAIGYSFTHLNVPKANIKVRWKPKSVTNIKGHYILFGYLIDEIKTYNPTLEHIVPSDVDAKPDFSFTPGSARIKGIFYKNGLEVTRYCKDCKDGYYYPFMGPREACKTCN